MILDIQTVGVAGAGTMGAGIAQLLAHNGLEVRLYDLSEEILGHAEERILRGLERAENPAAFSLIRKTTRLDKLAACEMVIEAIAEDLSAKQALFRQLDVLLDPPKILATNTSSLSVGRVASATENPDRVIGMHFFNPAPVMRLVEVARPDRTSEATVSAITELARRLGKTAVLCKDTPGFIANRVTRPFYLEGMRLLEQGAGSPAAIDRAAREMGGFRMGPFELMDLIGLDVNMSISRVVYEALGRPERLKPCAVQEGLVARGNLGRKNSRGFYLYGENPPGTVNPVLEEIVPKMGSSPQPPAEILSVILKGVIGEAKRASEEGVATSEDIDTTMQLGMNWPKGPFAWSREILRRGVT